MVSATLYFQNSVFKEIFNYLRQSFITSNTFNFKGSAQLSIFSFSNHKQLLLIGN